MGSAEYHLKDGWKRLEVIRKNGIYAGKADIYIYSPDGNKFRSKKELSSYLTSNNLPYKVEELFTATDASGSSSTKAADKSKKSGPPEKIQKTSAPDKSHKTSAPDKSHKASALEKAKKTSAPEKPPKSSAPEKTQKPSAPEKPQVPESAISAPPKQPPLVPDSGNSNASPGTSQPAPAAAAPSQKAVAPEPSSPGHGAHVMTTPHPGTFNILKERLRSAGAGSGKDVPANVSPFFQTPQGNPSFVPQKLGRSSAEARIPKPPKAPEKPLMPYMRYSRRVWELVKSENPDLKLWEIGKIIGQQWRDLPDEMKAEFVEEYESEKVEYERAMKIYYNSPAYLNYLQAKARAGLPIDDNRDTQLPKFTERRIDIQPSEEDDDCDDEFTSKSLAYARYMRNHRLMTEIFSDTLIPEVRFIVTTVRLQILRRQIYSLRLHQRKLLSELDEAEEVFQVKKRRIQERLDRFEEEMKKYSRPAVDEDMFERMVQREYEILKREWLEQLAAVKTATETTPETTNVVTPTETCESQAEGTEYMEIGKEPMEQAAAAAPIPAPVSMDIDFSDTASSAAGATPINNYSGMGYYTYAQPLYPTQPLNFPMPSQPQYEYPQASQQGYYYPYQQTAGQPGGYEYLQYQSYPRGQYYFPDPPIWPVYGYGAPIATPATDNLFPSQQAPIQPQSAPQYPPQGGLASTGPLPSSGQEEWENQAEMKTE